MIVAVVVENEHIDLDLYFVSFNKTIIKMLAIQNSIEIFTEFLFLFLSFDILFCNYDYLILKTKFTSSKEE